MKNAIVISTVIHFAVISPLYSVDISRDSARQDKPMTVDYLIMEEISKIPVEKIDTKSSTRETPGIEIKKTADVKPSQVKSVVRPVPPADAKKQAESVVTAKAETKIKETKDYINYYQLIRERIREKLKENYRYYYKEGDVYLRFTLLSDGSLSEYTADPARSIKDDTLIHIATVSLIEAAPFQPFPKALTLPKMSFNLIVSFKKQ